MPRLLRWAVLVICLSTQMATSGEDRWRFCVSADFASRRAYLTEVFVSSDSISTLETWYLRALAARGANMRFTQCPMPGDRLSAVAAHLHAEQFLHEFGFDIRRIGVNEGGGS